MKYSGIFIIWMAALLTACGEQEIIEIDTTRVMFDGTGFEFNGPTGKRTLPFGTSRQNFEKLSEPELGRPKSVTENTECPSGSLTIAEYTDSKLDITYQDGKFVGWVSREDSDDFMSVRRNWFTQDETFVEITNSSLDSEFAYGPEDARISGQFKDDTPDAEVILTWAGTNCIFR